MSAERTVKRTKRLMYTDEIVVKTNDFLASCKDFDGAKRYDPTPFSLQVERKTLSIATFSKFGRVSPFYFKNGCTSCLKPPELPNGFSHAGLIYPGSALHSLE
jgi:hypothetical protein